MTRSVLAILINTVRAQSLATLEFERLRLEGTDEFTLARARRLMLDGAHAAASTADMAESLTVGAIAEVADQIAALRTTLADHPAPQPDPPPQAA